MMDVFHTRQGIAIDFLNRLQKKLTGKKKPSVPSFTYLFQLWIFNICDF